MCLYILAGRVSILYNKRRSEGKEKNIMCHVWPLLTRICHLDPGRRAESFNLLLLRSYFSPSSWSLQIICIFKKRQQGSNKLVSTAPPPTPPSRGVSLIDRFPTLIFLFFFFFFNPMTHERRRRRHREKEIKI
jgi:hypothetical protein